ncbi:MAG: ABC transporter ATP-binding protein [Candidatus Pacearchaeota archaeon]|nr:MAG: ABC transporter ATP-binding protein [Candidatus Pacearchaeota archaeon]
MLEIKNLYVEREGKEILKGVNLKLKTGKIYALMGPNGSGKSTLAHVIIGDPKYKVVSGKILFKKKNILNLKPDERAKLGIFLSFQNPVAISGVTISNFLRQAYNNFNKKKISFLEFKRLIEKKAKELEIDTDFLSRYINEGFSGGEKKKTEILQLLVLNPKIAILDETDSGLDIDALKIVAKGINKFMSNDKIILIITHYKRILNYIKPDKIFVMLNGKIVAEGKKEVIEKLEKKGYSWIKNKY